MLSLSTHLSFLTGQYLYRVSMQEWNIIFLRETEQKVHTNKQKHAQISCSIIAIFAFLQATFLYFYFIYFNFLYLYLP
jgi:hypothetical protein